MKKIIICLFLLNVSMAAIAQNLTLNSPRVIRVNGVAKMEVMPDELTLSITITEYFKDPEDRKVKVTMEKIDRLFKETATKSGIIMANLEEKKDPYAYDLYVYGTDEENYYLKTKLYEYKCTNLDAIAKLLNNTEENYIASIYIAQSTNSKAAEMTDKLIALSLEDAKAKATKMLAVYGNTLGQATDITDGFNDNLYTEDNFNDNYGNVLLYSAPYTLDDKNTDKVVYTAADLNSKINKVRLTYTVSVGFEIK